jgi:DUF971 family protein
MASSPTPQPTRIKAPHGARTFEITWSDGTVSIIDHRVLRGYCPCATCQGHGGTITYHPGGDLELVSISRVGSYALELGWGDGHSSGIYSFEYLRDLSSRIAEQGLDALLSEAPGTS